MNTAPFDDFGSVEIISNLWFKLELQNTGYECNFNTSLKFANSGANYMELDLTTAMHMSKIAYSMYGNVKNLNVSYAKKLNCISDTAVFTSKRLRCSVGMWRAGSRCSIVVAFRGSSNGSEWLNNAHMAEWRSMTSIIAGRVHPGFSGSIIDVWPKISEYIEELSRKYHTELMESYSRGRSVPICITGHSRGGSLAVLGGLLAVIKFALPVHIFTFGAPRVGDSEFATAFREIILSGESAHWRFEAQGDPIPVFPFMWQAEHTGKLAYIVPGSNSIALMRSENHIARRAIQSLSAKPVRFHSALSYVDMLSSITSIEDVSVPPKSSKSNFHASGNGLRAARRLISWPRRHRSGSGTA